MNLSKHNILAYGKIFILFFLSIFINVNLSAQGDFCTEATEFCPFGNQDAVTFPAGTGGVPQIPDDDENDYGCLGTIPNPAWYYIEIGTAGNIQVELTNSNNQDIDFALWGPFEDLNIAFDACGTLSSPYDCSYSISADEDFNISQAQVGQAFILLITNFSNQTTNISGVAEGTGEISCCMLALDNGENCAVSSEFDCFCWNRGLDLQMTNNNGEIPLDFCGVADSYRWASFEACSSSSSIEISAQNCEQMMPIKVQLFSSCADLIPISDCMELTDNTNLFLTDLEGNIDFNFNIGETYSLLLAGSSEDTCMYNVTTETIPTAPIFLQDTLEGSFSICPNDTVTYALPEMLDIDNFEIEFSDISTEITEITLDSFTVFYGDVAGNLCVLAINEVGTTSLCQEVIFLPESICDTSVAVHSLNNLNHYSLQIIPNPVNNSFRFLTNDIGASWEMINTKGQILKSGDVSAEITFVSIQDLPTGAYFLRVKGIQTIVKKLIVND